MALPEMTHLGYKGTGFHEVEGDTIFLCSNCVATLLCPRFLSTQPGSIWTWVVNVWSIPDSHPWPDAVLMTWCLPNQCVLVSVR